MKELHTYVDDRGARPPLGFDSNTLPLPSGISAKLQTVVVTSYSSKASSKLNASLPHNAFKNVEVII
jgi:hypothetical protein